MNIYIFTPHTWGDEHSFGERTKDPLDWKLGSHGVTMTFTVWVLGGGQRWDISGKRGGGGTRPGKQTQLLDMTIELMDFSIENDGDVRCSITMLNYQRVHPGDGFPAHSEVETTHVTMTVTEHLNVTQSSPFAPRSAGGLLQFLPLQHLQIHSGLLH